MAVCVPSKATCRSTCGQQAKLHNTGLVIYWRCFLKSLLFWYRLKPMYPDTHDMVYDTSQSQIDHLAHSELMLTHSTWVFVIQDTRRDPSQEGRD